MTAPQVPRPVAWRIHADDAARFTAEGQRCQARTCRLQIAVVTWRWFKSAAAGRVIVSERFVCAGHGVEFAHRHRIELGEAPPDRSLR